MLIEAVDQNEARQDLEERLKMLDEHVNPLFKKNEERSHRVKFLETITSRTPALERALQQTLNEIHEDEEEIAECAEEKQLLKRRLPQSRGQVSDLLQRLHDSTDAFLYSLNESGILPPFRDECGALKTDIFVHPDVASSLRLAAECSRPLRSAEENVDESRRKFMKASESVRAATSPGQRDRRVERRSAKVMAWHREAEAVKMQSQHQQERQQEMLRVAAIFLQLSGLRNATHSPSESSSHDDAEEQPDLDQARMNEEGPRKGILKAWLSDRDELAQRRQALEESRRAYTERLVNHLYAYPQASVEAFDSALEEQMSMSQEVNERMMIEGIERMEWQYDATRAAARAAGITNLPLSPDWACTAFDIAPAEAPSFGSFFKPEKLKKNRRDIAKYLDDVAQVSPVEDPNLPSAMQEPPQIDCPRYNALPSPDLEYWRYLTTGDFTTLSTNQLLERYRVIREEGERIREEFEAQVGSGKYPDQKYHSSPMMDG